VHIILKRERWLTEVKNKLLSYKVRLLKSLSFAISASLNNKATVAKNLNPTKKGTLIKLHKNSHYLQLR
jgi:hypothetical protein